MENGIEYNSYKRVIEEEHININLERALNKLMSKEAYILIKHCGLFGEREHTLEEIGKEFSITGSRVGQLKNRAMFNLEKLYKDRKIESYFF
jgi:DNA-directed RNA polymerase sigma subunit (sigma70/sigma32)